VINTINLAYIFSDLRKTINDILIILHINFIGIAFGVAKVLDRLGAKLVFTYRKERSRKELEFIRNTHNDVGFIF
jgi:enoyl-[acyl-carrier-protein] reductase (NADH)